MRTGFPLVLPGQSIGIFGGSFDPPHHGHAFVSNMALKHLALDQIWWMPAHGNPLKAHQPAPISKRIAAIHALTQNPKMKVVDLEALLRTRYTIETVSALQSRFPATHFVLICGADILSELHRWKSWVKLASIIPICAFARPHEQLHAGLSPFATRFRASRISPHQAKRLTHAKAPCWSMILGPMVDLSSSEIRAETRAR